jgi:hypothetical protein
MQEYSQCLRDSAANSSIYYKISMVGTWCGGAPVKRQKQAMGEHRWYQKQNKIIFRLPRRFENVSCECFGEAQSKASQIDL